MAKEIKFGQSITANYCRQMEAINGKLSFHENGITFASNKLNFQSANFTICYNQISAVGKKSNAFFPTGLVVTTKDGSVHIFVVFNRDAVYDFINQQLQPARPSGEPSPLSVYDGTLPYIFISYAHADAAAVFPILTALEQRGFRLWFDQGIEVGTEWPEYIAEHLQKADSVIVFMSKAAANSKNCRREINFAIDKDKEPIVVYLEDVQLSPGMELQLNTLQAIFKHRSATEAAFLEELCRAGAIRHCRS